MANLGMHTVRILKTRLPGSIEEGDIREADVWANTDNGTHCAEIPNGEHPILLGRITDGGWEYLHPKRSANHIE